MKEIASLKDRPEMNGVHLGLTADIFSAYVSNNPVPVGEIANLIEDIHKSLVALSTGEVEEPVEILKPAVSIRKSVHDDHIVCLEDGKTFKSLKRHLAAQHGLTPDEYRLKWGLPSDYPMTARSYSVALSALAKEIGLGRKPKAPAEPEAAPAPKTRKQKPKAA